MSTAALQTAREDLGEMLVALASAEGSASHAYTHCAALNADQLATRNFADMLHLLSMLHGPQPGLIELTGDRNAAPEAADWLREAAAGFAVERNYITRLMVKAGPPPSTPGETETAGAILDQRRAIEMIACSDRFGCALGAAAALVLDWQAIRSVLDIAASRLEVDVPPQIMPGEEATADMLAALPSIGRLDRTLCFGGRQFLAQHYGLWNILEARAEARGQD